jgi:peptide/nickel transport system substrate-binding protein
MKNRYSRFILVVVFLLLGALLLGCTSTETPEEQPVSEEPQVEAPTEAVEPEAPETEAPAEKSQITIVIAEDPPSFNAAINQSGFDLVMELALLGLADMDQENAFPELPVEIPSVENGGVVIDEENGIMDVTWKLRQDIQWSDGTPVTADDVVFTYEAVVDPDTGYWILGIDYVDGVEKIDDYTVVVHYNAIYPGYLTMFGGYLMAIWPAHYCDAEQGFSSWDCGLQPLSTGPYLLEEWVQNDHLTFVKNPNYYQPGKPTIDEIVVKIIPDEAVRKQMLINGDADLDMWTPEPVVAELASYPEAVEVSLSQVDRWVMRIFFNLAEGRPCTSSMCGCEVRRQFRWVSIKPSRHFLWLCR